MISEETVRRAERRAREQIAAMSPAEIVTYARDVREHMERAHELIAAHLREAVSPHSETAA